MTLDREYRRRCMDIMAAVSNDPASATPEEQRQLTEFMVRSLGHRDIHFKSYDERESNPD